VEDTIVGMPLGRATSQNDKPFGSAVAMRGDRQTILQFEFAAIAFISDDRILAAEFIATFQAGPFVQPVLGMMHCVRRLTVHELAVTAMVAAEQKSDSGQLVLGPSDQVMAP